MSALPSFVQKAENGWHLLLRVQPGAKKNELCGESEGRLRLRLSALAVENKANLALLEFLAARLKVRKSRLVLSSGDKNRNKKVFIPAGTEPFWEGLLYNN